jgi:hypothetical protein
VPISLRVRSSPSIWCCLGSACALKSCAPFVHPPTHPTATGAVGQSCRRRDTRSALAERFIDAVVCDEGRYKQVAIGFASSMISWIPAGQVGLSGGLCKRRDLRAGRQASERRQAVGRRSCRAPLVTGERTPVASMRAAADFRMPLGTRLLARSIALSGWRTRRAWPVVVGGCLGWRGAPGWFTWVPVPMPVVSADEEPRCRGGPISSRPACGSAQICIGGNAEQRRGEC